MKNSIFVLVAMSALTPVLSFADGFKCEAKNTGLNFKMYNQTQPSQGTRNVSVMIVSDPSVSEGRKTIASFTDVKNTVSNVGSSYTAKVDLRVTESNRGGENIAGTKLADLKTIKVNIDFNYYYDTPSYNGEKFKGEVIYAKRNGETLSEKLDCKRYKNN